MACFSNTFPKLFLVLLRRIHTFNFKLFANFFCFNDQPMMIVTISLQTSTLEMGTVMGSTDVTTATWNTFSISSYFTDTEILSEWKREVSSKRSFLFLFAWVAVFMAHFIAARTIKCRLFHRMLSCRNISDVQINYNNRITFKIFLFRCLDWIIVDPPSWPCRWKTIWKF